MTILIQSDGVGAALSANPIDLFKVVDVENLDDSGVADRNVESALPIVFWEVDVTVKAEDHQSGVTHLQLGPRIERVVDRQLEDMVRVWLAIAGKASRRLAFAISEG